MVLSGPDLAVTNRIAESRWLFLAHVWPQQIVLPSLGGSAVTNRTAESWWLFLANVWL